MTDKIRVVVMPPRCGKSIKYNRFSKKKAEDICSRKLKPNKSPLKPRTCYDCYYHDGRCEWGKDDISICVRFKSDISFSNRVHHNILYNYDWCFKHFNDFCSFDKELFVAIHGVKRSDGLIEIKKRS